MDMNIEDVNFDERGLVPAIVQDARTGEVLTLAYMNAESLGRTLSDGETWFWSRSRRQLWHKGETSGNVQRVRDIRLDCDGDALLIAVEPAGAACHTGAHSCFHNTVELTPRVETNMKEAIDVKTEDEAEAKNLGQTLAELYAVIEERRRDRPEESYTTYLFNSGVDKILKKVGEEAAETIIAAKNADAQPLVAETADLLYHLLVLLVAREITLEQVRAELTSRTK